MSIVSGLKSQMKLDAQTAFYDVLDFEKPIFPSNVKLYQKYAASSERLKEAGNRVRTVVREKYEKDFSPPVLPVVRAAAKMDREELFGVMDENVRQACDTFSKNLLECGFGTIEWKDDETCQFTFPEIRVSYGLTTKTVERFMHRHELVGARQHKLPALDVKRPKFVDEVILSLPPYLHPHLRIVTGLEVVKAERRVATEQGLNQFGKFLKGVQDTAVEAGEGAMRVVRSSEFRTGAAIAGGTVAVAAAGIGIASLISMFPMASALAALGTMGTVVAIADPALCLGHIVLCGWENE